MAIESTRPTAPMPVATAVDLDVLRSYVETLGSDTTRRLVATMVCGILAMLEDLGRMRMQDEGSVDAVRRLSHDLSGLAGGLGLVGLVESLRLLERSSRQADRAALAKAVEDVVASRERIEDTVRVALERAVGEDSGSDGGGTGRQGASR